jgi:N-acetyl-anhydromuramyl-L-alanine amidase AmpD
MDDSATDPALDDVQASASHGFTSTDSGATLAPDPSLTDESAEYPGASRLAPAASGNYRQWSGSAPRPIDLIVLHITDGHANIAGPVSMFQTPGHGASAHYVVGQDGEVVQVVHHADIAWHAHAANGHSIGIEHCARSPKELGPDDGGLTLTPAQYAASAKLVQWLCQTLGLTADRDHVKGHTEADPATDHADCPNRIWDWQSFMGLLGDGSVAGAPGGMQLIDPYK